MPADCMEQWHNGRLHSTSVRALHRECPYKDCEEQVKCPHIGEIQRKYFVQGREVDVNEFDELIPSTMFD